MTGAQVVPETSNQDSIFAARAQSCGELVSLSYDFSSEKDGAGLSVRCNNLLGNTLLPFLTYINSQFRVRAAR